MKLVGGNNVRDYLHSIHSIQKASKEKCPKKWAWGLDGQGNLGLLATVFLAEVMPLYVLPESLGHLGWGDLLSFLPTEYSGEMFV